MRMGTGMKLAIEMGMGIKMETKDVDEDGDKGWA